MQALLNFMNVRGNQQGFLFCRPSGSPISYAEYREWFRVAASFLGFSQRLSPHSLRIGAATHAASTGMTDCAIRQAGRWASNSFVRYVRMPSMNV
ncbi:MAG: tyrosine-type recombinase/integrase [Planctomycetes bacterium]|nr:tyrosine-type recombinase/integrase [Planctomycetota bacterium]